MYDISMSIHPNMPVYKNRPENRPSVDVVHTLDSAGVKESVLRMNLHTGTHVDAPGHLLPGGEGADTLPLSLLWGSCRVVDLSDVTDQITDRDLLPLHIAPGEAILFKTTNSQSDDIPTDFVFLAESAASFLARQGVRLVGIDSLGVERGQSGHPTHRRLMQDGIVIVEGLRLGAVEPGTYQMICLPLKVKGGDGAPARCILIEMADGEHFL